MPYNGFMVRENKTCQLQIRVSASEKRLLESYARQSGKSVSKLVLDTLLQIKGVSFLNLIRPLASASAEEESYLFAELNDFLNSFKKGDSLTILPEPELELSARTANIIAAMIEHTAAKKNVAAPAWVKKIKPLSFPVFGTNLRNLREYLLVNTPVEFRQRNLFIDASIGSRV